MIPQRTRARIVIEFAVDRRFQHEADWRVIVCGCHSFPNFILRKIVPWPQQATFLDDESAMRESFSSIELSSAALDGGNDTHEMLLTITTQEVGIT
jgi:hypothetical protein